MPLLYPDSPSAITQAEDAFTYREEMRQLVLDVAEMENAHDHQITDIQGQLKGIQEQNRYVQMLSAAKTNRRLIVTSSARDSCLKQVWAHVRKLNEWAAEAREIINGKSLPSPGQCGSLDV
ncbi:hypothetical protein KXW29_004899 [Aspergillus fumigatus]|uniref:Uncharacterized protein n=1 Tax=Aspergillus fumigatus TaxID=746128 RepID=A0A9P8N957_ASPFM|nr:hypothetical protein KXV57_002746 [Aspergillus fumigatus]KAH2268590.1 hypothetical protein KXW02_002526 [Aspergillus fumigatus]KAH2713420.1 hypothetical protein KXW29_004899 [Aspergillus fumigatus]